MLTLTDILRGSGGQLAGGHSGEVAFERAVIDSREVHDGDLFIALKGERVDGNDFVPHAIANHAAGIISHRAPGAIPNRLAYVQVPDTLKALQDVGAYKLRQVDPLVIGITGSVGKTSTKEAIAGALAQRHQVLKTERNLNTEIGVPLSLLRLEPRHDVAVLEMGMYVPGDIRFLAELTRPRIGVVTSVSHVHAERVGSIERIAEAKAELVDHLPKDGIAVLNGDDPFCAAMAQRGKRSLLFGLGESCQVRTMAVRSRGLEGISLRIGYGGSEEDVDLKLLGRHSAYHALAAVAVMLSMDYSLAEAVASLAASPMESLRLRIIEGRGGVTVIDDSYNSSPVAAKAALALLAEAGAGVQRAAVLGDMRELGTYSAELHREVGAEAASRASLVITVGDEARLIAEGALAAGLPDDSVMATTDPQEAIDFLKPRLNAGDYLLIKGSRALGLETIVREFQS